MHNQILSGSPSSTEYCSCHFFWSWLDLTRCPPFGGQTKRRATKIRPKAVACGIFGRFANFDKFRPEGFGDVISGAAVGYFGADVCATFGESGLNSGRIIGLFD